MMKTVYNLLIDKRKNLIRFSLFMWMILFSINSVSAQTKTISGTIKDADGLELPGASVLVKGTNIGVVSDFDGKYTIKASNDAVLVFSFISLY